MRPILAALLLLAACAQCRPGTTIYLVRHAEKAKVQGDDPSLTATGRARAEALMRALDGVEIDAIYATQYRRTVQTVQPVADARGVPIQMVKAHDNDALIEQIRQTHRGERVLVAGHSNTVPELIRAMGVRERVVIEHDDYGDLFVVTIADDGIHTTLERRRFDP